MTDVLDDIGRTVDLLETDLEIIRSFVWVDDDAPLPIDPFDYSELDRAHGWFGAEINNLENYISMCDWEAEDISELERDLTSVTAFHAALARRMRALKDRDCERLRAWSEGRPIAAK